MLILICALGLMVFRIYKYRVNQAMFSGSTNLNNYASGGDVRNVKIPQVSSKEANDGELNDKALTNQQEIKTEPIFALLDHQIPNLVTLSLLPRSQWQSLTNIDIIKVCFIEQLLLLHSIVPLHTCREPSWVLYRTCWLMTFLNMM